MKLFRYRRPSLNRLLGVTKAKQQIKKDLGIYNVTKVINAPKNAERRALRHVGYYSPFMTFLRFMKRKNK
jgi:hypothetical protein